MATGIEEDGEKRLIRSASEEVSRQFRTLVDASDIDSLKQLQHLILGRLQDSNAVLTHFNEYSERCYAEVRGDFTRSTHLLKSMKADLDHIFIRLRSMKAKLQETYPDAFPEGVLDQRPDLESPFRPS
ncbi:kxDL motif protein [Wolffia australiana]